MLLAFTTHLINLNLVINFGNKNVNTSKQSGSSLTPEGDALLPPSIGLSEHPSCGHYYFYVSAARFVLPNPKPPSPAAGPGGNGLSIAAGCLTFGVGAGPDFADACQQDQLTRKLADNRKMAANMLKLQSSLAHDEA